MVISAEQITDIVEGFIRDQFHVAPGDTCFNRDAHLFDLGFVDSAGVVELIVLLEKAFRIHLDDDQIFSDAFTTINGIGAVVCQSLQRRRNGSEPAVTDADDKVVAMQAGS